MALLPPVRRATLTGDAEVPLKRPLSDLSAAARSLVTPRGARPAGLDGSPTSSMVPVRSGGEVVVTPSANRLWDTTANLVTATVRMASIRSREGGRRPAPLLTAPGAGDVEASRSIVSRGSSRKFEAARPSPLPVGEGRLSVGSDLPEESPRHGRLLRKTTESSLQDGAEGQRRSRLVAKKATFSEASPNRGSFGSQVEGTRASFESMSGDDSLGARTPKPRARRIRPLGTGSERESARSRGSQESGQARADKDDEGKELEGMRSTRDIDAEFAALLDQCAPPPLPKGPPPKAELLLLAESQSSRNMTQALSSDRIMKEIDSKLDTRETMRRSLQDDATGAGGRRAGATVGQAEALDDSISRIQALISTVRARCVYDPMP